MKGRVLWARLGPEGVSGDGAEAPVAWWSVTKTVIAAAVLRLAARGALALDAPRPEGSLRALLAHRAGLGDYGALPEYRAAVAAGAAPWPAEALLARVPAAPDRRFRYSNVGYLHLRRTVEAATGATLDAALRALVLAPLGVPGVRVAETVEDLAATALPPPGGYDPGWVYHGCLVGAAREAVQVLAGLPGLLGSAAWAEMAAARPVGAVPPGRPWQEAGYGLGLMAGRLGGGGLPPLRAEGHTGGGPGSACAVYRFPGLPGAPAVAVFAAEEGGAAEARALALARAEPGSGYVAAT